MLKKFIKYMISPKNKVLILVLLSISSCALAPVPAKTQKLDQKKSKVKTFKVKCTESDRERVYELGDLVCVKNDLKVNHTEKLKIRFKVTDKNSLDVYKYGYQELLRYKNGKVVEKVKLRRDEDAYWSEVPFVRVRKQKFLADLDGDGYLEFAVYPFHPGTALYGEVRIFSLKDKIEFWGNGKYFFEGDSFVQLGCMKCSKFRPEECKKCR